MWQAYDRDKSPFKRMTGDDEQLMNFMTRSKVPLQNLQSEVSEATSKYIASISPNYAVQRARIDIKDPNKARDLDDFLAEKRAQYESKGALATKDLGDYNPTTATSIRTGEGSSFQIEKRRDGGANVIMFGAKGSKQVIPATASEVARFFPEVAVKNPFSDINDIILTSPDRTTNAANQRFVPGSGSTAVNAKISGYQLPQLKGTGYESKVRLDVEGSLSNTGNPETDLFTVIMYVPDPKTGTWKGDYLSDGYVSSADALLKMQLISPISINDAIKTFK